MTLGESLKKIRKQYKMTQDDIAKIVGVSRSGYTYYETGKSKPSIEVLKKLATIYDTTIDTVVGMPQKKTNDRRYSEDCLSVAEGHEDPLIYMKKDEQALIMMFRLLSSEDKEELSNTAYELLKKAQEENIEE